MVLFYEFFCDIQFLVGVYYVEGGDVVVLDVVCGFFFYFGEDIVDDFGVVIGGFCGVGDVDCYEGELGLGEGVVEVVFEEVVFGEVFEVGVLDEGDVGGVEEVDVYCVLS